MFRVKKNKIIADVQWSFISLLASSFVQLFLRIILGKELGPSGLGLYTLIFSIYMFGTIFASFGIEAAMTQYISRYVDNLDRIKDSVNSGIIGSLASGLLMGTFLYLLSNRISLSFFHNPEMIILLKITALCYPFIAIQKATLGVLNGLREMKQFAFINVIQNIAIVFLSVFLVFYFNMNVIGAVIGFVAPTIITGLLSVYSIKEYISIYPSLHSGHFNKQLVGKLFWFGYYTVLGNSISMINTQIDTWLIGHFMTDVQVGIYTVAVIFIQGITLLPSSIQRITTPIISRYYGQKDYSSIKKLIKDVTLKTFTLVVFLSLLLALLGKHLISFLFTVEYLPAYVPLLILLIGYSIYAPWSAIGAIFYSIGKIKVSFRINILCATMNTIMNIILIPKFGLVGAASATSISLVFTVLVNTYFMYKYSNLLSTYPSKYGHI